MDSTLNLTQVTLEKMSVQKFMRLKKDGKLSEFRIKGIGAPTIGSRRSSNRFGSIIVERVTPTYKVTL